MNAINVKNENKWENNSPSSASSSLTGNTTTTTIGGTTYSFSPPVAGAFVQLPPGIIPNGSIVITTTGCGPEFSVEEVRKIRATTNVAMGLFTSTRDNGIVAKAKADTAGLVYGVWEVTGRDGDQVVEERVVNGFQAIIYAYLAGSSASSGLNLNGQNGAGAISGSGGIQTFGKEIDKVPCSFKETRKLTPVKEMTKQATVASSGLVAVQLDTANTHVPGKVTGYALTDKPKLCQGKPIPEGKRCTPIREKVKVLTGAEIRAIAGAKVESKK